MKPNGLSVEDKLVPAEHEQGLGQFLFQRHGGKVVFFSRFIAVLRALAAFLVGVNRMEWRRFLIATPSGSPGGLAGIALGVQAASR